MTSSVTVTRPAVRATAAAPVRGRVRRRKLEGAQAGKLYFAQVREDPLLEIDALAAEEDDTVVIVGSGGCTALSLLAAGAGRVVAVDLNSSQTSIIELKAAAIAVLDLGEATRFLGGAAMNPETRLRIYSALRSQMSMAAADYWNANLPMIADGVIASGVSERFISGLASVMRKLVHPRGRIERLLACKTIGQQRHLYDSEWDSRRWRLLFRVLLNRWTLNRTYDPQFFANVENPSFSEHFRLLFEHALCDVPVGSNYFLHFMLTGAYPIDAAGGLPPYLDPVNNRTIVEGKARRSSLELVDGRLQDYLSLCGDSTIDALALSNICEWLTPAETDRLFGEVIRVARPGARVCFRNFVGYTSVPERFRSRLVEDVERSRAAIRRDRSCVQSRIAICTVEK